MGLYPNSLKLEITQTFILKRLDTETEVCLYTIEHHKLMKMKDFG